MRNINDFSMDFFSLKGKNAIVTGGVSGLGQGFALALAKAGANIFVFAAVDDDGTTKKQAFIIIKMRICTSVRLVNLQ